MESDREEYIIYKKSMIVVSVIARVQSILYVNISALSGWRRAFSSLEKFGQYFSGRSPAGHLNVCIHTRARCVLPLTRGVVKIIQTDPAVLFYFLSFSLRLSPPSLLLPSRRGGGGTLSRPAPTCVPLLRLFIRGIIARASIVCPPPPPPPPPPYPVRWAFFGRCWCSGDLRHESLQSRFRSRMRAQRQFNHGRTRDSCLLSDVYVRFVFFSFVV